MSDVAWYKVTRVIRERVYVQATSERDAAGKAMSGAGRSARLPEEWPDVEKLDHEPPEQEPSHD